MPSRKYSFGTTKQQNIFMILAVLLVLVSVYYLYNRNKSSFNIINPLNDGKIYNNLIIRRDNHSCDYMLSIGEKDLAYLGIVDISNNFITGPLLFKNIYISTKVDWDRKKYVQLGYFNSEKNFIYNTIYDNCNIVVCYNIPITITLRDDLTNTRDSKLLNDPINGSTKKIYFEYTKRPLTKCISEPYMVGGPCTGNNVAGTYDLYGNCVIKPGPCTGNNGSGIYDSNGQCTINSCNSGYNMSNGLCVINSGPCTGNNGSGIYDSNGQCTINSCNSGYNMSNGLCVLNKGPCTVNNGSGIYDSNGQCTINSCNSGYNMSNGLCVINSGPCTGNNGSGIYDSNGQCTINSCNSGYNMSNGLCVLNKGPCTVNNGSGTYDSNGQCTINSCNKGYIKINNRCESPIYVTTSDNVTTYRLDPKNSQKITDYASISSVPINTSFIMTNLKTNQTAVATNFVNIHNSIVAQWYSGINGPMGGPIWIYTGPTNNMSWDKFVNTKSIYCLSKNCLTGTDTAFMPPLNPGTTLEKSMQKYATRNVSAKQLANNLTSSLTPINGGIWTILTKSPPDSRGGVQYVMQLTINCFAQYCINT